MRSIAEDFIRCMDGGCSAVAWTTSDGKNLWGRNFDFNRIADGTVVAYIPSHTSYYTCGTDIENNLDETTLTSSKYAAVGTGLIAVKSNPILYEGINEKGLMGGQLYYRGFAHFNNEPKKNTAKVQPPMFVYHALAQCENVNEVIEMAENKISLVNVPMFGTVPTIHWSFSDRSGETIVIEPDKNGITVYRNTIGVMTNSPSYSWHRLNLLNYVGIRDLDYDTLEIEGDRLNQCFSGSGAAGLPGDFSSPSRFVRLAFLKKYGVKGKTEEDGVVNMLHMFGSAAFPRGIVRVSEQGHITELDKNVEPFDYTVYTSVMCAQSLKFYWTSYENQRVRCIDLNKLIKQTDKMSFDISRKADFLYLN